MPSFNLSAKLGTKPKATVAIDPSLGTLPLKPSPGLPNGGSFNWDSLPVAPDGPDPTSGILAVDKIIPAGTKHYISTLDEPRKKLDRIPQDEFSTMVQTYNQKFGTNLPNDPMNQLWHKTNNWWGVRESIMKVAVGRWNSYMCQKGQGHCPHPGMFKWLGKAISSAVHVISKVIPFVEAIPIIGSAVSALEKGVDIVKHLSSAANAGAAIVAHNPVFTAGKDMVAQADKVGYDVGAAVMSHAKLTEAQLIAVRNKLNAAQKRGFDTAVSIASGMATSNAHPTASPTAKAAFYATMGMQGAKPELQKAMLKQLAQHPEAKQGVEAAASQIKDKTFWIKVKEFFGVYEHPVVSTKVAPKAPSPRRHHH